MIRKLYALLTVFLLLQVFCIPAPVNAAEGLTVTENTAETNFPSTINFKISAQSNTVIEEIRLHYRVERMSYARITSEIYMNIQPGRQVSSNWTWDMRKTGGLPPGTRIYYWWTLKDAFGTVAQTKQATVRFDDTNHTWKSMTKDNITLLWYKGDDGFADNLLNAATDGLKKLHTETGVNFTDPVDIYIYEDSTALRNGMIFPQEWTGGIAYPSYSTIAIGISPDNLDWGIRTVVHELTHLVTHRITENPYQDLPTWLDEGLSMYMEGPLESQFTYYFNMALANNSLISVRSLASPFSAKADVSYLSYAESYYIVDFLINQFGQDKLLDLLTVLSEGNEYDAALKDVYGFDMDGLNDAWVEYMHNLNLTKNGVQTQANNIIGKPQLVPAF